MSIKSIKGMLKDFAPQNVEAIAVFMKTGFNTRRDVWQSIPDKKNNLL